MVTSASVQQGDDERGRTNLDVPLDGVSVVGPIDVGSVLNLSDRIGVIPPIGVGSDRVGVIGPFEVRSVLKSRREDEIARKKKSAIARERGRCPHRPQRQRPGWGQRGRRWQGRGRRQGRSWGRSCLQKEKERRWGLDEGDRAKARKHERGKGLLTRQPGKQLMRQARVRMVGRGRSITH
jgi:hypothetical protein